MSILGARRILHLLAEDGTTVLSATSTPDLPARAVPDDDQGPVQCYRMYGAGTWFDITTITGKRGSGDVTKMRYWGLLEREMDSVGPDGNPERALARQTRGSWWLRRRILVPKYAVVYDNELLRLEGEQWSVGTPSGRTSTTGS